MLAAAFAYLSTLDASVAAVANYLCAVNTGLTVVTEVSVSSNAVLTGITCAAYFGLSTSGTFFLTVGTYNRTVLASRTTVADHSTVSAVVAAVAPSAALTTIFADIASAAEVLKAVVAMFTAFRADYSAGGTSVAAGTNVIGTLITGITVATEEIVATDTVDA